MTGACILVSVVIADSNMNVAEPYAFPVLHDSYEMKDKFQSRQSILIVNPRVVNGDRERLGGYIGESDPRYKIVMDGLYLSGLSSLHEKGYKVYTLEDFPRDIVESDAFKEALTREWEELQKFTDSGKSNKRKMLPYKITSLMNLSVLPDNPDILLFVQCYGKFDYQITPQGEMTGVAIGAAASYAAIGTAIVPYAGFFGSPEYSNFDYKISALDAKSGELIWYREGWHTNSDIRNKGKLGSSFDEIFSEYVPAAKVAAVSGKFKLKRSSVVGNLKGDQ